MRTRTSAPYTAVLLFAAFTCYGWQDTNAAGRKPEAVPELRSSCVLGPDDQITIRAMDAEEISDKPIRIGMDGFIRLPLIGRLRAQGLTIEQFEAELARRLKPFVREPDVTVSVNEFRSQPVSVIGSVKNAGIHQLQGSKTLIEVLSLAGGLTDTAGATVRVTRRLEWGRIPVPGAADDPTGRNDWDPRSTRSYRYGKYYQRYQRYYRNQSL